MRATLQHMPMRRRFSKAVPWVVSGASTLYVFVRAHRLSRAESSDEALVSFLLSQSDLIVALTGTPLTWYFVSRRQRLFAEESETRKMMVDPHQLRQLRQVLSVLMLGLGMIERRLARRAYNDLSPLVQRLHMTVRQGAIVLAAIERQLLSGMPNPPLPQMSTNGNPLL